VRFLPVISNPTKILCAGINYPRPRAETGRDLPTQPSMFIRFSDTLVSHGKRDDPPSNFDPLRF